MKTISQHLGQIILAVAAVALIIGVVLTFGTPVHNFMDGVMDKLYDVGNGPIWNVGGTATNPDEGGSGAGGTGDEDSVLGLRRFNDSVTNYIEAPADETSGAYENFYNNNFIAIETITLGSEELYGFTPTFEVEGVAWVVVYFNNNTSIEGGDITYLPMPLNDLKYVVTEFTVTSTANSTVDEWLLANTEPVENSDDGTTEEETYVIEAGTYRFNDVLNCDGLSVTDGALLDSEPVYYDFAANFFLGEYSAECTQIVIYTFTNYDEPTLLQFGYVGTVYNGSDIMASDIEAPVYNLLNDNEGYTDPPYDTKWLVQNYEQYGATVTDLQTCVVLNDIEVDSSIGTWFTANTKRVIEVDELPTEDIDTGAIYKVNELVEDTDTSTIAGTWVINETTSYTGEFEYNVDFYVVNGTTIKNYIGLFTEDNSGTPRLSYRSSSTTTNMVHYFNSGNWAASYYKTITITGGDDIANEDFATWLQSNATKYKMVDKYYQYVDGAWVEQ
ncbi:MAG: hypothetical protein IJZ42_01845 [Lachnospiraceae bacterium]|nr:hypothetical protein [Lachnospiraceae bacterium]